VTLDGSEPGCVATICYRQQPLFQVKDAGTGRSVRYRTLGFIAEINRLFRQGGSHEVAVRGRSLLVDGQTILTVMPQDCGKESPEAVAAMWATQLGSVLADKPRGTEN
jgi:hypothetical protein